MYVRREVFFVFCVCFFAKKTECRFVYCVSSYDTVVLSKISVQNIFSEIMFCRKYFGWGRVDI